ncbi:hypothetical protein JQX13_52090 [Archangium violaceum]|nr:hypothetical protein [Archangium violaceum]QRK08368.1 hypothetical protein JQX13_52090 [Archangium violaceum]
MRELMAHQVTGTVPGNPWVQLGLWLLPLGLVFLMMRLQGGLHGCAG